MNPEETQRPNIFHSNITLRAMWNLIIGIVYVGVSVCWGSEDEVE